MWKMAHYMDPLSMLFDEAEPEDGDDTTGAVEGDINPSVDAPAPASASTSTPKGAKKQNGGAGGGGGKAANAGGKEPTVSKKAQKRAERKAEQKQLDEEKANNGERERSPADLPDAKRAKVDAGKEVLREAVSNAV